MDGANDTAYPSFLFSVFYFDEDGDAPWNGTIDDVMIFNRSLSAEEIVALYAHKNVHRCTEKCA